MTTHNELLALAAHLHVMIRRKIGRITDPEWMVSNAEYAREVIRLARTEPAAELAEAVNRFEQALFAEPRQTVRKPLVEQIRDNLAQPTAEAARRYVGGLR
ncbi:hypothetical protein [Chitinimonas koreensis]|uniref:hypothetical protein n=1 Tax=Chitinimonas koreensis TaxID=356302 RepID=UPI00040DF0AF|nr:hypothetical protein [Chitinimonas koreensis]QNM97330.1 hypothetical protein H9L41_03165 [Chitinimonas koreensis]